MSASNLRIDLRRLQQRLDDLARVGAIDGGGVCRLALSDQDRAGRDTVIGWMKAQGLRVPVDAIGNVMATRPGRERGAPVMTGSHIDTVATGGRYDGVKEEGCDLIGGSCIIAPTGEIVARCESLGDELVVHECDLDRCKEIQRNIFNFSLHREPQSYQLITQTKGAIEPS